MTEKVKSWFEWIPGWIPICFTLILGAMWVGKYTQSIDDRLSALEKQMVAIQEYIRSGHQTELPMSFVKEPR